jgi:RNA polymerase sigma-70 factor (sigma-E family)
MEPMEDACIRREPEPVAADESFERFFEAEFLRLLRALFVLTGSANEAEDLAQDAFVSVWERWDYVASMDDPVGYLYRTALNRHRSRLRHLRRAATRALGSDEWRDSFADADERDEVAHAIASLPTRQRTVIVLTAMLGFGTDEVAAILGVQPATVRSLTSHARAALRKVLER